MTVRIKYSNTFRSLPAKTRKRCWALTHRDAGDSGMRDALRTERMATPTFVAYDGANRVLGWAILTSAEEIMVYVRRSERRKGIGKKLLRSARSQWRRLHRKGSRHSDAVVYPHDTQSFWFFNKMGCDYASEEPPWL